MNAYWHSMSGSMAASLRGQTSSHDASSSDSLGTTRLSLSTEWRRLSAAGRASSRRPGCRLERSRSSAGRSCIRGTPLTARQSETSPRAAASGPSTAGAPSRSSIAVEEAVDSRQSTLEGSEPSGARARSGGDPGYAATGRCVKLAGIEIIRVDEGRVRAAPAAVSREAAFAPTASECP
jgi:hypothetical protein